MITDNKHVLTDEQILAIGTFGQSPSKRLDHGRAIEQAVLSKLRGASQPVAYQIRAPHVSIWRECDKSVYDVVLKTRPHDVRELYAVPQASAEPEWPTQAQVEKAEKEWDEWASQMNQCRNASLKQAAQKLATLANEAVVSYESTKEPYFEGKSDAYSHAETVIRKMTSAPAADSVVRDSLITADDDNTRDARDYVRGPMEFDAEDGAKGAVDVDLPQHLIDNLNPWQCIAVMAFVMQDRQQRGGDVTALREALKFYADQDHFIIANDDA